MPKKWEIGPKKPKNKDFTSFSRGESIKKNTLDKNHSQVA